MKYGNGSAPTWSRLFRATRLQSVAMLIGGISLVSVGLLTALAPPQTSQLAAVVLTVAWVLAGFKGAFQVSISREDLSVATTVGGATTTATVATTIIFVVLGANLTVGAVLLSGALAAGLLFLGVQTGRFVVRALWRAGTFRTTAIVVGSSRLSNELVVELSHSRELGIDVVRHIDVRRTHGGIGAAKTHLSEAIEALSPDRLIFADEGPRETEWIGALRRAGELGTRVYVLPRLFEMGGGNSLFSSDELRGFPLQRVNRPAHPRASLLLKRCMDVIVSAIGLLAMLPFLAAAGVVIKLTSPGPVLFWQERVGQHNRTIWVPKLRSMTMSASSDTEWTAEARISPIGKILRRSALDEIPQLWSVLVGDMSLVGPRPERPAFVEQFSDQYARYKDRHRMRAGLTGLSQIAGLRGDTSIAERAKYDNRYIDQWTLTGDFIILARTVVAIVRERVYADRQESLSQALTDGLAEGLVLDDIDHSPADRPTALVA